MNSKLIIRWHYKCLSDNYQFVLTPIKTRVSLFCFIFFALDWRNSQITRWFVCSSLIVVFCVFWRNAINAWYSKIKMKHWLHCVANTQIRGGSNAFTHNNNALKQPTANSHEIPRNEIDFCFILFFLDQPQKHLIFPIYGIRRPSCTNVNV